MNPDLLNIIDTRVGEATRRMDLLLTGVIVVLFLGFITLLVTVAGLVLDANRFKAETYQNLVNQVNASNTKLDQLTAKYPLGI